VITERPPASLSREFQDPFGDPFPAQSVGAPQRRSHGHIPGEVGIWVFIFGDMLAFSLFFSVFVHERAGNAAVFQHGRETLNLTFGAVNTLLLLTGSLFVALAMPAIRKGASGRARRLIVLAMGCGAGFVANKALEYSAKLDAGHTPDSSDFYMYFFGLTGIHLLHLLIGMLVLAIMWRICRKPVLDAGDVRYLEAGASYWHLVDLLWIVLFALLYLMR